MAASSWVLLQTMLFHILFSTGAIVVPVPFSNCQHADGDPAEIANPSVTGDQLTVSVSYSGGCEEHSFQVCWDGQFVRGETEALHANLEVWHHANSDTCEAYPTDMISFDLAPLKQAWRDTHGQETGSVLLKIGGDSVTYQI
mmetsp:Transcript_52682/g.104648  ORF Transcript_52682/g.104648 Transcript_52682/m.104648 type:complete len:142 (+) Transcript_52682:96-521(+)